METLDKDNINDPELEVQRYQLGLMTPDEEVAFEHGLSKDAVSLEELRKSGDGLTAMYEGLAKGMPNPRKDLKRKLLDSLSESNAERSIYDVEHFVLRAAESHWKKTKVDGIEFKILYQDEDGRVMVMAKLEPGARYPDHPHRGTEECLVLSGDFWTNGQKLGAGDFIAARAGADHDGVYSEGGCELLLKLPLPHEIMPD